LVAMASRRGAEELDDVNVAQAIVLSFIELATFDINRSEEETSRLRARRDSLLRLGKRLGIRPKDLQRAADLSEPGYYAALKEKPAVRDGRQYLLRSATGHEHDSIAELTAALDGEDGEG